MLALHTADFWKERHRSPELRCRLQVWGDWRAGHQIEFPPFFHPFSNRLWPLAPCNAVQPGGFLQKLHLENAVICKDQHSQWLVVVGQVGIYMHLPFLWGLLPYHMLSLLYTCFCTTVWWVFIDLLKLCQIWWPSKMDRNVPSLKHEELWQWHTFHIPPKQNPKKGWLFLWDTCI